MSKSSNIVKVGGRAMTSDSGQTVNEYVRIMNFLGITTQVRLAEHLGVRQSSISDALNRSDEGVPTNWKLTLLKTNGLSPMWVETGCGSVYLLPSGNPPGKTPLSFYSTTELMGELQKRIS